MSDEILPIALRPEERLLVFEEGGKRILSEMVNDVMALASVSAGVLQRRFKIGDVELCEPDYRQILHWADSLELAPEEFLSRLLKPPQGAHNSLWPTVMEDGRLVSLFWDFRLLPLERFRLLSPLSIDKLSVVGGITELDLSQVPNLTLLDYCATEITELDLSQVPNLTELNCIWSPLLKRFVIAHCIP